MPRSGAKRTQISAFVLVMLTLTLVTVSYAQTSWRDPLMRSVLRNTTIEASFQGGQLYRLKDLSNNKVLLEVNPADLPAKLPVFGPPSSIDLDACKVKQSLTSSKLVVNIATPSGDTWNITWRIERGRGDLVCNSSATSSQPIPEMRAFFFGADIKDHQVVWMHGYGTGNVARAPYRGAVVGGNPLIDGAPFGFPHPPVALFESSGSGWFIEGRDPRPGPAFLMINGVGDRVDMGMTRLFPFPKTTADMYEVRIRTYKDHWEDAVDPYVNWMEKGAGFVPMDKLPKKEAWVAKLRTQAYVRAGDYERLEELAKHVNPMETYIGRLVDLRPYGVDIRYPDYKLTESAKPWVKRLRQMGFHVGMHVNVSLCSVVFPDLVEKMKPGMQPTGKDANGNQEYAHLYEGQNKGYWVSPALPAWRECLLERIKDGIDAGVDVIYLDCAMAPNGKPVVGDTDGWQGTQLLMKEIQQRYPGVAVETEQFNMLTAKYGKIALSQMPLGHPLSGYIFRRFVKVVPEGYMYSPVDNNLMDALESWGFMLPGADSFYEKSGVEITEAFHKYKLTPDIRLPHYEFPNFASHLTGGVVPVADEKIPDQGLKLFGYRGANGVTAYFEKFPNKRGLVVYEPGKEPRWIATRYSGLRTYSGPGLPQYMDYREQHKDWLLYDGAGLIGLDPKTTYSFDTSLHASPTRFHICQVPEDFACVWNMEMRAPGQEVGDNDDYFIVRLAGHGKLGVYIPDGYEAYLNGAKLEPDAATRKAEATVSASADKQGALNYYIALNPNSTYVGDPASEQPAVLIGFRKTETELGGKWKDLRLYRSRDELKSIAPNKTDGFSMAVGAIGRFVGKIPAAKSIRLQGSFRITDEGTGFLGDFVVRINGTEVLRVPHGERPYKDTPFDVDISKYAGQYAIVEFMSDANVRGGGADVSNPQFIVAD